jgi:bifunctional non-homologous end joining protein LigD
MGSITNQQGELTIDGNTISITSIDKPLWPKIEVRKLEYLNYLIKVGPRMLPFLDRRLLTVIRYPHGFGSEFFYQKNCPEYAPHFIETYTHENIDYIICSNLSSLIWLGNQLAFEYHIPFATINSEGPSEIVFDLDPPSRSDFSLAIKAALYIKEICDQLNLISFVKTSGNKGLQIYIPLPENAYSYDDTRLFTKFIADYLIQKEPTLFTIERLKKNRGERLYVDYIQHSEGKTIIAPYSPRGNEDGLVATPLFWEEVSEELSPEQFHLQNTDRRLNEHGCPFADYFEAKQVQKFGSILEWLKSKTD